MAALPRKGCAVPNLGVVPRSRLGLGVGLWPLGLGEGCRCAGPAAGTGAASPVRVYRHRQPAKTSSPAPVWRVVSAQDPQPATDRGGRPRASVFPVGDRGRLAAGPRANSGPARRATASSAPGRAAVNASSIRARRRCVRPFAGYASKRSNACPWARPPGCRPGPAASAHATPCYGKQCWGGWAPSVGGGAAGRVARASARCATRGQTDVRGSGWPQDRVSSWGPRSNDGRGRIAPGALRPPMGVTRIPSRDGHRPDHPPSRAGWLLCQCSSSSMVVIAQQKPASSRATATVTIGGALALGAQPGPGAVEAPLRRPADRDRGRRLAALALLERPPRAGAVAVVPGRLDQQPAGVARAGLGDRPLPAPLASRGLGRHQPDVAHQPAGAGEATEVADLGAEPDRRQRVDAAQAAQAGDLALAGRAGDRRRDQSLELRPAVQQRLDRAAVVAQRRLGRPSRSSTPASQARWRSVQAPPS